MLKRSWCKLPFLDVNWDNFSPIKVWVFFWVLRHGNTRTRASLFCYGSIRVEDCPFCFIRLLPFWVVVYCWRCILVHLACSLHFGLDLIMELTHH
jgi:hypothetical protein